MRSRIAGGIGVFVLVLAGFASVARADGFQPSTTALGPNHDVVPDTGAWTFTGDFAASFVAARNDDGTVNGTWSFNQVNPFRSDDVRDSFDDVGVAEARAFLSSPHAASRSARLDFTVAQMGDRDADDHDDFRLTLNQATFVGPVSSLGNGGLSSGRMAGLGPSSFSGGGVASMAGGSQPLPTPEPASLILLGSGLVGVVFGARKKLGARS